MTDDQRLLFGLERRIDDDDDDPDAPLPVTLRDDRTAPNTDPQGGAAGVDLTRALPHLQVPDLQRIGRRFAPHGRVPVNKAHLCELIAAVLASPDGLDAVIARLAPLELELLTELARRGGAADAWELATQVALRGFPAPPVERRPYAFNRWLGNSGAEAYLRPLVDDGLLVHGRSPAAPAGVGVFDEAWVGADPRLLARLPRRRPGPPAPLEAPEAASAPAAARHPAAVVLEVLDAAHLVLDLGGVPLTRSGTIARPFVRRAERGRPLRAWGMETLLHTLFALGLMRPPSERAASGRAHPWQLDRDELAKLLRLPPYLAYAAIVDAVCRVGDGPLDDAWSDGLYGAAPTAALRRSVFDALAALPPHPVTLDAAATALWRGPLVQVYGWPDRHGGTGEFGRRQPSEVAAVLSGACVRLGLLATSAAPQTHGGAPHDALEPRSIAPALGARWYAAARARLLGRALPGDDPPNLGGPATRPASADRSTVGGASASGDAPAIRDAPTAGGTPAFVVQPNFEVHAYLDRLDADAISALTSATAVRIDPHTAVFEIDRRSASRAIDVGRTVDGVIADLRVHAGAVPDNVERALRDWAARRERLRVTLDARLVEFADEAARDAALPGLGRARPVGERFALLAPRTKPPAGELHRYGDPAERGLAIDRAGALRVTGPLDLAGRAVVHALTRPGSGAKRVFDPGAIRAGPLPGGWRDVLRARLAAAPPAHVDALLRALSGDAPEPVLQSAVLFRHPKASAWAQHPRLAPHLTAALSDGAYLVEPAAVAPLLEALRELGFAPDAPVEPAPDEAAAGLAAAASARAPAGAPTAAEPVDALIAGLSTRRVRERLEEAIAGGHDVELRYTAERERYGRYGRTLRARGRKRTARFRPLLVRYRGSIPYLHARPVDGAEDDEELIRIGYIEAIAVLA